MAKKAGLAVVIVSLLLLSACNFPLFGKGDKYDDDAMATVVAETVQAFEEQNWTPTPTEVIEPTATATSEPTATKEPTKTPKPTKTTDPKTPTPSKTPLPCNERAFTDETIPDGTEFEPGKAFTKEWTYRNIGTCTWNKKYKVKFASGDQMEAPSTVFLDTSVAPDKEVTFKIGMKAPDKVGTYSGRWNFYSDKDELIGYMTVVIKVIPVYFAVTSVEYNVATELTPGMTCPEKVTIRAKITTDGPGDVTFYWENNEGRKSEMRSQHFDKAETNNAEFKIRIKPSANYWAQLYIDNPNHQWFGPPIEFTATCD